MISKKFLVIGSNSFSGSHFVTEALRSGHKVWGVSRSQEPDHVFLPYYWPEETLGNRDAVSENFSFQAINLNTQLTELIKLVDRIQPEVIVNFAAQGMVAESWLNPTDWYKTNVVSQVALHDSLRKRTFIEKYVHVSTPEVYGSTDKGWIRENNNFAPSTPYAVSRAACDMHLLSFQKAYSFPVVFTRAANVYGPGQQLYRIIPRTMLSARTGKPMQLHGGGNSERCFIYIRDAMQATLRLALEADPGTCWHLSSREPVTIRNIVEQICDRCKIPFSKIVNESDERLGKDQSYLLDSSSIREEFGWTDHMSLEGGLEQTLNWVDKNIDQLSKHSWTYQHQT